MPTDNTDSKLTQYLKTLGLTKEDLEDHYAELQRKGLGFGVVVALKLYGALNLKSLSDLLDSAPNTILHQIKQLFKENFIEIDAKATAVGRGKYYKITQLSEAIFTMMSQRMKSEERQKELEIIKKKSLDELLLDAGKKLREDKFKELPNQLRLASNIQSYVERITIQKMEELREKVMALDEPNDEEIMKVIKDSHFSMGSIELSTASLPITNKDQMVRFFEVFQNFLIELHSLDEQFNEENQQDENKDKEITYQHVYSFSAPVNQRVFESED